MTTILVGGHESAHGTDLDALSRSLPDVVVAATGRPLRDAVTDCLDAATRVAVLPMTWGRDPALVADTAATLRWLATGPAAGWVSLCSPFGIPGHLVSWLRKAAVETARDFRHGGLLLWAPAANPYDDAELYRIAHLVRTYGAGIEVEVACLAEPSELRPAVRRAWRLGARRVVVAPAGFARTPPRGIVLAGASFFGPLMSEQTLRDLVRRRVDEALDRLDGGDDGIAAGLLGGHHPDDALERVRDRLRHEPDDIDHHIHDLPQHRTRRGGQAHAG